MTSEINKKILIIEDDTHIAEGLRLNLTLQGYEVLIAANGLIGLEQWKNWQPDLIILDIMLPGINGLNILQNIRLVNEWMPILILSAKASAEDKITGLSFGVDDYLSKPFNLDELLLRVKRLLERSLRENIGETRQGERNKHVYVFGDNKIDFTNATAFCKSGQIELTEQEVKLLKLFIANKGKILSRNKLLEIGWGYSQSTITRTLDNFIVRFRKYFEENPKKPVYFKSHRTVGYIFDHD